MICITTQRYYDIVKRESGNILYILFRILYWIYFSFIILMMTMKRHVTLWSHDVMS